MIIWTIKIIRIAGIIFTKRICLSQRYLHRVGIIAEARKVFQCKAFADFDAIKIAFWREFDATHFQRKQKCSDETNRQSISFILHNPRYLNNKSDRCGSPNQSCKKSSYRNNPHPAVTSTQIIFISKGFLHRFCTGTESVCVQMCPINSRKYLDFLTKICEKKLYCIMICRMKAE